MTGIVRHRLRKLLATLPPARRLVRAVLSLGFRNSPHYWERRYAKGGDSGSGSYGKSAEFKAAALRRIISEHGIRSVVDFGCGDGHQIGLVDVDSYVGLDVSPSAVEKCRGRFEDDRSKSFHVLGPRERFDGLSIAKADMAMSLDVLYHLVEDEIFESHLRNLFSAAERLVVVYSSNVDELSESPHVRHRQFTDFVAANFDGWTIRQHIDNPDTRNYPQVGFYVFERREPAASNRRPPAPSSGGPRSAAP